MSEEREPEEPAENSSPWPAPRWLEPHESPFGIRVYDCRRTTQTVMFAFLIGPQYEELNDRYSRATDGQGEEFRGTVIQDALRVPCELTYPGAGPAQEGRYFRPDCMEDRWCVDYYDGCLQFVKIVEGFVVFRARLDHPAADRFALKDLEVHPSRAAAGPGHALDAVDYLMKAYFLRAVAPHPFPPALRDDPAVDLAKYSINEYGRRALFGTFETTRGLDGYPWDVQKVVFHGIDREGGDPETGS